MIAIDQTSFIARAKDIFPAKEGVFPRLRVLVIDGEGLGSLVSQLPTGDVSLGTAPDVFGPVLAPTPVRSASCGLLAAEDETEPIQFIPHVDVPLVRPNPAPQPSRLMGLLVPQDISDFPPKLSGKMGDTLYIATVYSSQVPREPPDCLQHNVALLRAWAAPGDRARG